MRTCWPLEFIQSCDLTGALLEHLLDVYAYMDANLSVRTMGFVNILFYRDQSGWLRSGETLQTHQTGGSASWIPHPQWPIKPHVTIFLCKRNGSSMWVSLHQHLLLSPPTEATGRKGWCAIHGSHCILSVCPSYLANRGDAVLRDQSSCTEI